MIGKVLSAGRLVMGDGTMDWEGGMAFFLVVSGREVFVVVDWLCHYAMTLEACSVNSGHAIAGSVHALVMGNFPRRQLSPQAQSSHGH
jgi:hypothetical protein